MADEEHWMDLKRRQKRVAVISKAISGARDFLGLGRFFETDYVRDFSGVTARPQTRAYLQPQEVTDHDESELFEMLAATFAEDTTEKLEPGIARSTDGRLRADFIDPHWGHTTGHLFGTLKIDGIDRLHEDLRVGLFEAPGSYRVFCRPNYLFDPDLPIAINRLSLKLKLPKPVPNVYSDQAEEMDILLSEGLPPGIEGQPDGQGFFFRDARQLLMANQMKDGLLSVAEILLDVADAAVVHFWKKKIFSPATDMLYREPQTRRSWERKWYYSAGPYALGDGAMKYALEPLQTEPGEHISIFENPAAAHAEAFRDVAGKDTELHFRLRVQVATEAAIPWQKGDPPRCVMAAEYTDIAWDTSEAPFVAVGTLTLRPHRVNPTDPATGWYAMPFNAWNTFETMRPLGQLFRARKIVHLHHRAKRLTHSFGDGDLDVPIGRCPFAG